MGLSGKREEGKEKEGKGGAERGHQRHLVLASNH